MPIKFKPSRTTCAKHCILPLHLQKPGVLCRNYSGQENSSAKISLGWISWFLLFFHGGSIPHPSDPWFQFHVLLPTSAGIVLFNIELVLYNIELVWFNIELMLFFVMQKCEMGWDHLKPHMVTHSQISLQSCQSFSQK